MVGVDSRRVVENRKVYGLRENGHTIYSGSGSHGIRQSQRAPGRVSAPPRAFSRVRSPAAARRRGRQGRGGAGAAVAWSSTRSRHQGRPHRRREGAGAPPHGRGRGGTYKHAGWAAAHDATTDGDRGGTIRRAASPGRSGLRINPGPVLGHQPTGVRGADSRAAPPVTGALASLRTATCR